MVRNIWIVLISFVILSCGNHRNFNKQKYTNLSTKSSFTNQETEEQEAENDIDQNNGLSLPTDYDLISIKDDLNDEVFNVSSFINPPELTVLPEPTDSTLTDSFEFSSKIQEILLSGDSLFLKIQKKTYYLKNASYDEDTGVLKGNIETTTEREQYGSEHIFRINSYSILNENLVQIPHLEIQSYEGGLDYNSEEEASGKPNSKVNRFFGSLLLLALIVALGLIAIGLSFFGAGWVIFPAVILMIYCMYLLARLNRSNNSEAKKRKQKRITWISMIAGVVACGIGLLIYFQV